MAEDHFPQFLKVEGTGVIELCAGQIKDGRDFFAFLQMDIESHQRYRQDLSQGRPMDLNSYGKVLHTGWGKEPDEATSAMVMKKHTDNLKILQAIGEHATAIADIIHSNSKDSDLR